MPACAAGWCRAGLLTQLEANVGRRALKSASRHSVTTSESQNKRGVLGALGDACGQSWQWLYKAVARLASAAAAPGVEIIGMRRRLASIGERSAEIKQQTSRHVTARV